MPTGYSSLFSLYVLPTGRVRFCLSVLRPLVVKLQDERLLERIGAASAQADETWRLEAAWARQRKLAGASRGRASKIDPSVDRLVTALSDTLQTPLRSLDETHPLRKLAQELIALCFPSGAFAVTSLPYDEELVMVEWILEQLDTRSEDAATLGLTAYIAALSEILPQYRAELSEMKPKGMSYDDLQAARRKTHARLLRVVARIVDEWGDDAHEETLYTLLTPVVFQNDQVAEYYRRRVAPKDVDPQTGEETAEVEDEGEASVASN